MNNDKILPTTRIVAIIVIPFLWLAFLILFFFPETTGERFAWRITPHMTSLYIGAGYLGGSWLFVNMLVQKRWHRVKGGFFAITTFTWFMLLATLLHWERFSHGTLGFTLWLILYIVTPFLVPVIWNLNRKADTGQPEESDVIIAPAILWILRLIGTVGLVTVAISFVQPDFLIRIWPWALTPLTARVMCGWIALLSVGAFAMSADPRWTSWRVPLQSILIWHVLVLVAVIMKADDFTMSLVNWYTVSIFVMVVGILVFYPLMERKRKQSAT
ncbi:MAG TPA: hypothetical protein PLF42_14540 [Anaerolineales bacterium]|nr:hypothetical protein [Anaerolineales bacterium]